MDHDIIIAGGGASGLAAAISAKENCPELSVAVAERLDRVGKKILSTGNGRCNLSNTDLSVSHYHGSVAFTEEIFRAAPTAEDMFIELGVVCVTDEQGRMYPASNSAASVLSALRMRMKELSIDEICGFDVVDYVINKGIVTLHAKDGRKLSCRRLVISAGGYAAPDMGTDGTLMRLLRNKGYKVSNICPAVAPLKAAPESLKGLKGVRVKGKITAVSGGKELESRYGEIQFTENTVSGICVFDLAYLYQQYEGGLILRADLSDMSHAELFERLKKIRRVRSSQETAELLTGLFPKNLAVCIVKNTLGRPMNELICKLTDADLDKICRRIKQLEFKVTGAAPWKNSQATMGGVHAACVDVGLRSKLEPEVYLCGEILDIVGDCGGYNLQWAWSSGYVAGKNAAMQLKGVTG